MRRLSSLAVWAGFAAVLLFSSCGADDGAETAGPDPAPSTTAAALSEAVPTTDLDVGGTEDRQPSSAPARTDWSVVLRGDGLGVVRFGQTADEVLAELGAVIGLPPTDAWSEADCIRYTGWSELGLFVGFDTPTAEGFTGVSRFVGWDQVEPEGGPGFATAEGISVGSTLAETRVAYGDRLHVATEPDECAGDWFVQVRSPSGEVELLAVLDRAAADDARISLLHAGIGVGC